MATAVLNPLETARAAFPILNQEVNGKPLVYLDNAASTQKPMAVLDALARYYRVDNANVHRGIHELSRRATEAFEEARARVAAFVGVDDSAELIWTRGATEAINMVATCWGQSNLSPGDEILLSVMEHHSNLVPWQMLAQRTGAKLRFLGIDEEGKLELDTLDEMLGERTRLVSLAHVSNALGTINPIREIADRAHSVGALMMLDAAQSVPHLPVSFPELGCDFAAFSGHKMCGPTGIGALWGRRELLESMPPWLGGGDMIDRVELETSTYAGLPTRFEAGTPHIAGAIGLAAAVDFLTELGMENVAAHGRDLIGYAFESLAAIPDLHIYGPADPAERSAVLSFTLADIHPHDLATILDMEGVAIRAGHHCTQPLMKRLGVAATARASFYLYNTREDVDRLVAALHHSRALFGY